MSLLSLSRSGGFGESVKLKEDLDDGDKEVRCERFFCALALCDYCPHCIFDVLL